MTDIDNFKQELKQLLDKYGAILEVSLDGDTEGIETSFDVEIKGYTYILHEYESYLDSQQL